MSRPELPLAPFFDACVFSIEVGTQSADPAMYLTAAARVGVPPERCLYVVMAEAQS